MIRNVYLTQFQALLRFGILFSGGIEGELSIRIIRITKRVIRSMVGVSSRTSCRQLFKGFNILTLASLYNIGSDLFYKQILSVFGAKF